MKNSRKISLTLLITVLLCGIFTIIAFSNLFTLIETGFFSKIAEAEIEKEILLYAENVESYHKKNIYI